VGEHRTLGGFYPVLLGEKVIAGGSIREYPKTPEGSVMNTSLSRLVRMVVAPVILGLGVTACTQGASPPPPTQGFTTRTPTRESAPPSSAPMSSPTAATSVEQSTESSSNACTSRMLQELQKLFEGRSPGAGVPDVRIERCTNGYAHAFSPPTGGEQYFLQYLNGSWQVVVEGTGVACGDPDAGRALLRVCAALGYRTTAVLQRISDPQVVADRLVRAWMTFVTTRWRPTS
jgi:hypothetical protein